MTDRIDFWESHSKKYGYDWPQNRRLQQGKEI